MSNDQSITVGGYTVEDMFEALLDIKEGDKAVLSFSNLELTAEYVDALAASLIVDGLSGLLEYNDLTMGRAEAHLVASAYALLGKAAVGHGKFTDTTDFIDFVQDNLENNRDFYAALTAWWWLVFTGATLPKEED